MAVFPTSVIMEIDGKPAGPMTVKCSDCGWMPAKEDIERDWRESQKDTGCTIEPDDPCLDCNVEPDEQDEMTCPCEDKRNYDASYPPQPEPKKEEYTIIDDQMKPRLALALAFKIEDPETLKAINQYGPVLGLLDDKLADPDGLKEFLFYMMHDKRGEKLAATLFNYGTKKDQAKYHELVMRSTERFKTIYNEHLRDLTYAEKIAIAFYILSHTGDSWETWCREGADSKEEKQ
jgi:hypothetical protein